jgi:hypothetical protein
MGYNRPAKYAREWGETEFGPAIAAMDLRKNLVKYVMDETYIPKRWRFVDAFPAIKEAELIRRTIVHANALRTNTDDPDFNIQNLKRRIQMQNDAMALCDDFDLKIQDIVADCQGATYGNIKTVTDALIKVKRLCTSWQKSDMKKLAELKAK